MRPAHVPPRNRLLARFFIAFALLLLVFGAASASDPARRHLHEPLGRLLARTAGAILSPFLSIETDKNLIRSGDLKVAIVDACDGVLPTLIYLAAVLAFPSRWGAKVWGILIGIPAIFVVNLARILSLLLLGLWRFDVFEVAHIYVWQALVIALSMAIWVFWVERFVRPRAPLDA